MKRLLITSVVLVGILFFSGLVYKTNAQQVGGSLIFGSEIENIGLRADGAYTINEDFRGAADITFFFPKDLGGGNDWTWWAINVNGHYLFAVESEVNFYGLAGLNLATQRVEFTNPFTGQTGSNSNTELGLNLGGGVEYPVNFGNLFGELKYTLSDFDQLEINAGVRIPIGG